MPRRVQMGRAMCCQANPFDTPAFPVGKVFFFHAGKKLEKGVVHEGTLIAAANEDSE